MVRFEVMPHLTSTLYVFFTKRNFLSSTKSAIVIRALRSFLIHYLSSVASTSSGLGFSITSQTSMRSSMVMIILYFHDTYLMPFNLANVPSRKTVHFSLLGPQPEGAEHYWKARRRDKLGKRFKRVTCVGKKNVKNYFAILK